MRPIILGSLFPLLTVGRQYPDILPAAFALGQTRTINADAAYTNQTFELSPSRKVLTIDYGLESAGFPFFDVLNLTAPAQIEVRYAESYVSFESPYSDGPWTFSNGLSNTFRVETFNLTQPGRIESFFVQGGQRWETIRLLSNETVRFASVGLKATSEHLPSADVPGQLKTSNDIYNKIWDLGPRVVQAACIDSGNAPSTWEITSDGAFVRGQQTASSVKGTGLGNYTLTFATKITRGGTGWRVAAGTVPFGPVFYLTSEYPEATTYVNVNRTLMPPNTLVFNYGWSIVNQTTLEVPDPQYFPLNRTVKENVWYNISTTITADSYDVFLDGVLLASIELPPDVLATVGSQANIGAPAMQTDGTWAFGP